MTHLGTFAVCISFILWGFLRANKEKNKVEVICEVERLINYMSSSVSHYRRPLYEIYQSFESPILESSGFASNLSSGWCEAVATVNCPPAIKKELMELGVGLGMMSTNEQVLQFERCLSTLSTYTEKEKLAEPNRILLYRCLGITSAAAFFILTL